MVYLFPSFEEFVKDGPVLALPLWQVLLFVVLVSLAAMFERHRLVLVLAYVFALYWVFIENLLMFSVNRVSAVTIVVFVVFGLAGLTLTLWQMISSRY